MQPARDDEPSDRPGRARPSRPGAKVVMINLKAELGWLKVLGTDPDLSHVAVRVALVMAKYFNSESGGTFVGQARIALEINASERTAWTAIKELEERGWIALKRRGGKGRANTYLPAVGGVQLTATNADLLLATGCEQSGGKGRNGLRSLEPQGSQNPVPKVAADCELTLKETSFPNSSALRTEGTANHLGPPGALLEAMLTKVVFESWFLQVAIERIEDDELTLSAPSDFTRDWIISHFLEPIIASWRRAGFSVTRVHFRVRK